MIGTREAQHSDLREAYLKQWNAILEDQSLADLPYRVETDRWGYIRLTPITNRTSRYATQIAMKLNDIIQDGEAFPNGVTLTNEGVRVPNVVWSSPERLEGSEILFLTAPELYVEVASGAILWEEIHDKARLYFDAGALEVWTCDLQGNIKFYDANGVLEASKLAPAFPSRVELKS